MKNFVLIDGFAMMFRSYYAVRFAPQYEGQNINAVYGCATTIMQALEQFTPEKVLVAFDAPEKTFRHELDPEYKAQRTAAPDEFIAQIQLVKDLIEAFNIPLFISPGFEADDIIGTLATQAKGYKSYILSGDLDFLQLVNENITLARFNGKGPELFDAAATEIKLGIPPAQVIDYKAMCGDSSDNYKGIPGLGPKGAVKLLKEFSNIQGIYENLEALPPAQKLKFEEHRDYLMHCQHLATIEQQVPLDFTPETIPNYAFDSDSLEYFFRKVGFNRLLQRMKNLNHKSDQTDLKEHNSESEKDDENKQLNLF
jgi:DNA polymerase-1